MATVKAVIIISGKDTKEVEKVCAAAERVSKLQSTTLTIFS